MAMAKKVITGVVLALVLFPLIYFGGLVLDIAIVLLMAIMAYEVSRIRDFKYQNFIMILILAAVIGLFFCLPQNFVFYLGCIAIVAFSFPLINDDFKLIDVVTLFTLIFMAAMAVIGIRNLRAYSLAVTFLVVLGNFATDTFAFFVGSFLGKHKLAPTISPKKSVEGAIGGWIGGFIFVIACRFILYPEMSLLMMAIIAVFMPLVTQIGDLAFSLIKRNYNIKDFGSVFGNHGGVFDRIDSLIFAMIFVNFILNVVI